MLVSENQINVCQLIKEIKKLKFKNTKEINRAGIISDLIFYEWKKATKKTQRKLKKKTLDFDKLFSQYEAEVDILIGFLCLINKKILCNVKDFK